MVEQTLTNAYTPMRFSAAAYQMLEMPMLTDKAQEQAQRDAKAKGEAEPVADTKQVKRSRAKEPVA